MCCLYLNVCIPIDGWIDRCTRTLRFEIARLHVSDKDSQADDPRPGSSPYLPLGQRLS